ncbi:MAG: glycosyltransferase [Rhizobiaceae bacterium]|nr:glycosyltransferase [Rhizobiaceae bacterium]MCV0408139.1 glycosyltransferase [Rhizobiaceae bacterium]
MNLYTKNQIEEIRASGFFDQNWYLEQYPDAVALGMDPLEHYLWIGAKLDRRPSRGFDGKAYLRRNPEIGGATVNPLAHYALSGRKEGRAYPYACPEEWIALAGGRRQRKSRGPTIIVCAHAAGHSLFGGERSFLDVIQAFDTLGYAVVAILPGLNEAYYKLVREFCTRVYVVPYGWWRYDRAPSEKTIRALLDIIAAERPAAVHVNTIMLREPHLAARRSGVPSVVHVRELIDQDPALAAMIGADPRQIVEEVVAHSDYVLANSIATEQLFNKPGRTHRVANTIDVERFSMANEPRDGKIRIGIISSNIPKKGIADFVDLAIACRDVDNCIFTIVGPMTNYVRELQLKISQGAFKDAHLEIAGYFDEPRDAIASINVVANFSHFAESFGRTVLEGMAAGRPAIAYSHGALPELIEDGRTGFLVPFKDIEAASRHVRSLAADFALLARMGEAGRQVARQVYSRGAFTARLGNIYRAILQEDGRLPARVSAGTGAGASARRQADVSVIIPNYNYEHFLEERLNSILNQTVRPREIIFLDDNSSDGSVALARTLLDRTDIPHKIIVNTENAGTYRQWLRGMTEASGEFIWIAEADDRCHKTFLERMTEATRSETVVLAYCQSRKIDENGLIVADDNLPHTNDVSKTRWDTDYRASGYREVLDALAFRNTIPNVSACLLRRETVLKEAAAALKGFRYCGDWALYVSMLRHGDISYVSEPLNDFRRHTQSITRRNIEKESYLLELAEVQRHILELFPVPRSVLLLMNRFIDRDYRIAGIQSNSTSPAFVELTRRAADRSADIFRLAFITTNNGSYNGGSEVLWIEAAKRARAHGHDVIILIKKWQPTPAFLVEFARLGIRVLYKEENGFAELLRAAPDLTVVSTGDQDEGTEFFGALHERHLPYVIVNQLVKEPRFWPIRLEKIAAVRSGYLHARQVFFTCKNNHRVMEQRISSRIGNWSIHYNPHHLSQDRFPPFPPGQAPLSIAVPARIRFVHKGHDVILNVIKSAKWQARDVHFNFYGDGPDRDTFIQMTSSLGLRNVTIHDRVADVSAIWETNHALLLASRMEGLPIVLVGAMLSARVPIVTDIGGHSEVVEDGRSGFIARQPDEQSVDEALERAFHRRHEWQAIGMLARESILRYLPVDPVEDFLARCIGFLKPKSSDQGAAVSV